jgi:hypothetical protein
MPPFSLLRSDQYRPSPPYKIDSKKYTADYNEIKMLGGNGTTTPSARTPDQTQIARFWYESSPLGWNRIARTVSEARGVTLWDNGPFALRLVTIPRVTTKLTVTGDSAPGPWISEIRNGVASRPLAVQSKVSAWEFRGRGAPV